VLSAIIVFAKSHQSDTIKRQVMKIDIHNANWGISFCNGMGLGIEMGYFNINST
jgi:hypothetical protein